MYMKFMYQHPETRKTVKIKPGTEFLEFVVGDVKRYHLHLNLREEKPFDSNPLVRLINEGSKENGVWDAIHAREEFKRLNWWAYGIIETIDSSGQAFGIRFNTEVWICNDKGDTVEHIVI